MYVCSKYMKSIAPCDRERPVVLSEGLEIIAEYDLGPSAGSLF